MALHFLKETFEVCDFYLQCFKLGLFVHGNLSGGLSIMGSAGLWRYSWVHHLIQN